jgi:opacity protein-like surface antigen
MNIPALSRSLLPLMTLVGLGAATSAVAQSDGDWQYEATPYLWFPGTEGDAQAGTSPTIHIDQSPSENLKQLDIGLMGTFEARKDRWGMVFDAFHVRLSDGGTVSQTILGAPVEVDGDVGIRQTILSAAGYYRVTEGATAVDVVGGMRWVKLRMDADLSLTALGQLLLTRNPSYSENWIDPFVGVRVTAPIAPKWALTGYADIGGFGVGSDNTWQLQAGATYTWNEKFTSTFGYRALHVNYDDNGFDAKLDFQGLYTGLGIKF